MKVFLRADREESRAQKMLTQKRRENFFIKWGGFCLLKKTRLLQQTHNIKAPLLLLLFADDAFRRSTRRSKWYA